MQRRLLLVGAAAFALLAPTPSASAAKPTPAVSVTWSGNGMSADGQGGWALNNTLCAPAAGADDAGNYLLFVLGSTKTIDSATITIGTGAPVAMVKSNGAKNGTSSFKFVYRSDYTIDLAALLAGGVTAQFNGAGTPTLTISHGCNLPKPPPPLQVTYLGEAYSTGEGGTWQFGAMGSNGNGVAFTVKVCETAVPTNCVTFSSPSSGLGSAAGSTQSLTMSAPGTLTVLSALSATDPIPAYSLVDALWASSSVTAAMVVDGDPSALAAAVAGVSSATTVSFDNGGTVYLTSFEAG